MKQGPNVKKLITRRMAQLMVPDGGGLADGIRELASPGNIGERAREATVWVGEYLAAVKLAPDNPYGDDDEAIAEAILNEIGA